MAHALDIECRFAIVDTIHTFFHLVDSGQASRTADLFTSDAKLVFGPGSPQPGTIEGSAIANAMTARENLKTAFTRHCICNIVLAPASDGCVTARYLMILFRSDDETRPSTPAFVADVDEIWRRDDGVWKIAQRTLSPTFFRV